MQENVHREIVSFPTNLKMLNNTGKTKHYIYHLAILKCTYDLKSIFLKTKGHRDL